MPLPTPYSYRTYLGDGTTDVFAVPFPYIVKAHVKVYVNWSVDDGLFDSELLDGVGFDWVGDTSINVTTAPIAPNTISVVRLTPVDQRVTQWQAGSPPTAFELTAADEQVLFVVQEFIDRVLATQGTLNFVISDGLTTVIDNLLSTSPTAALSANQGRILKGFIDTLALGGGPGGGGGSITVEDILTSVSTSNPLSANMGRVLKELIDALDIRIDAAEAQNRANQAAIYQTQAAITDTAQVPAGTIVWLQPPATPTTPPVGFLYCNGSNKSRSEYPELFNAIGTTYGAGDGTTTFGIPLEASLINPFPGSTPAYRPYVRVGLAFPVTGGILAFRTANPSFDSQSLSGNVLTSRANFATAFSVEWVAMAKDASYAACSSGTNNLHLNILRRTVNTWVACTIDTLPPGELPGGAVFSLDGTLLIVGTSVGNHVYTQVDASTWTRSALSGPAGVGPHMILSKTGRFVSACAGNGQPFTVWEISGATVTLISTNAFPGAAGSYFPWSDWGPGDNLVVACVSGTPLLFARSGTTFTALLSQPTGPGGDVCLARFSPDGTYLVSSASGIFTGINHGILLHKITAGIPSLANSIFTTGSFRHTSVLPIPGRTTWTLHNCLNGQTYVVNTATDTLESGAAITGGTNFAPPFEYGLVP